MNKSAILPAKARQAQTPLQDPFLRIAASQLFQNRVTNEAVAWPNLFCTVKKGGRYALCRDVSLRYGHGGSCGTARLPPPYV